ncbi:MAG: alkaline phosphatase PhoX [Actinomycetota bacterium]
MDRRSFLRGIGCVGVGFGLPARAVLAPGRELSAVASPYGELDEATAGEVGVIVPAGFAARVVAVAGEVVSTTGHEWHRAPDGAATFPTEDGWIYVCNSEVPTFGEGGVGAIRFVDGEPVDAYPILTDTTMNCAGGPTPWGTWLSCEEFELAAEDVVDGQVRGGMVWETDPSGAAPARAHPAMGVFQHEAAAVDPVGQRVYLTEDQPDGRLYRFTPDTYPDLWAGALEAAVVDDSGSVSWIPVPDPTAATRTLREQVPEARIFPGGEGIWYHDGVVVFTTKRDVRVHELDVVADRHRILYDGPAIDDPVLDTVDNVTVHEPSGDVYVAEDGSFPIELVTITPTGGVHPFVRLVGDVHRGSEITGPCFSPDGSRLYFSSQRGGGAGMTFEVSGPFRTVPDPSPPSTTIVTGTTAPSTIEAPTSGPSTTRAGAGTVEADDDSASDEGGVGAVAIGAAGAAGLATTAWIVRRRRATGEVEPVEP